jgi:DNA modification methylase
MSKSMPKKPNMPTQIEWAPIESVTPYARNPRKIGADAISAVAGSIKEFGFKSPIIVDKDRVIINGHTRLKAAQQLGLTEVPVVVASDLTPEQVRAYRIADNRSAEFSKWDEDFLKVELDDIGDIDLSFCNVDEMLAELAEQSQEEPHEEMTAGDPDAVPELKPEAISQRGEVFELGPHRLMCGDSTSAEDWHALMGGEKAQILMTDPPYNVAYEGNYIQSGKILKQGEKNWDGGIANDNMKADFPVWLGSVYEEINRHLDEGAAIYIWHPPGAEGRHFWAAWLWDEWHFQVDAIWNKTSLIISRWDYKPQHEPCMYGWKGKNRSWIGPNNMATVWDVKRQQGRSGEKREHPTMKPIDVIAPPLRNHEGPIVLEPFGGSGTTLIAAAKTGRICRAMEIAPRYCDVIRRRWTKFAKENNVNPGTGALE